MPCDTQYTTAEQTQEQRDKEIRETLARLDSGLMDATIGIAIGENGAIAFTGWTDRQRITDVCAYRALTLNNSFGLRLAVARAQATTGRTVNESAIAAGVHSHDNGQTWHSGH